MRDFTKWKYSLYTVVILIILQKLKLEGVNLYITFLVALRLIMEFDI